MKFIRLSLLLFVLSANAQSKNLPEFTFLKSDKSGTVVNKDILTGKKSLFIFFDITCPHCQEAIKAFNKNAEKLSPISVYLVTLDKQASAEKFLSRYATHLYKRKNVTLLFDRYNEFIVKFQPVKYPSIFLYSENRNLELYSDEPHDVPKFLKLIEKRKTGSLIHKQS
jgi:thiol-disulfide isomerase/thioredoxin